MSSAVPKSDHNQQIVEYMENLSKDYFNKIFPGSIISIKPKTKSGKQGGHILKIENDETGSTNTSTKVIHK